MVSGMKASVQIRLDRARLASAGPFMAPMVVDEANPLTPIAHGEAFGPILSALVFASTKEAVALANRASYGLPASVWSGDLDTVAEVGRKVRAGAVWANAFMEGFAELPFGGFKQSGLGRELGRNAAADYTEEKTFHVHNGPCANWPLDPKLAT
jgi:acyl-CoA reductase-like NAD-dependent aldehyde dehydrogenase